MQKIDVIINSFDDVDAWFVGQFFFFATTLLVSVAVAGSCF